MKSFILIASAILSLGLGIANAEPIGHAAPAPDGTPSGWTAGAAGWG